MTNSITSKIIGGLVRDKTFFDWWQSEAVAIPFFDHQKLPITFTGFEPEDDETFIEEADKALTNFLNLGMADRDSISKLVYKNLADCAEEVDDEDIAEIIAKIRSDADIWQFVHPIDINVSRRPRDNDIYIQIACECDWEAEHGLQLVFKKGVKVTRVSAQDGHLTEAEAYAKPDEQDELLSQF